MVNKRIMAATLATFMSVSMFAGCSKANNNNAAATKAPEVKKTYNLKMLGMRVTPNPESEVMKKFNASLGGNTLEVTCVPDADYISKLQLLLTAQDLPDIFHNNGNQMILEKASAKFTEDEYKNYMPDVYNLAMKQIKDAGLTKESVFSRTSVNGKLAGFGFGQVSITLPYGMIVRSDMLESLGIKDMPKTLDQWENVFKAYKQKNPNKYPIAARGKDAFTQAFRFVLDAYKVTPDGWHIKDGKLVYGPYMPEMREALGTLQKWYKAGYINPEWVTMDQKTYNNEFINGNTLFIQVQNLTNITAAAPYIPGSTTDLAAAVTPSFKAVWAPWPSVKEGQKSMYPVYDLFNNSYVIFGSQLEKDKNKMYAAMDVMNKAASKDLYILRNYGIEGQTFDYVDGVPTIKKDLNNDDAKAKNGFGWLGALNVLGTDWELQKTLMPKSIQTQVNSLLDDKGTYGKNSVDTQVIAPSGPLTSQSGEDLNVRGKAKYDQWTTVFSEVVIGKKSLEDYDKFIAEWQKEVGNELTESVNRLYLKDWKK